MDISKASPRPWNYHRGVDGGYDCIKDVNGKTVVEGVGRIDGPLIIAAVNAYDPKHEETLMFPEDIIIDEFGRLWLATENGDPYSGPYDTVEEAEAALYATADEENE